MTNFDRVYRLTDLAARAGPRLTTISDEDVLTSVPTATTTSTTTTTSGPNQVYMLASNPTLPQELREQAWRAQNMTLQQAVADEDEVWINHYLRTGTSVNDVLSWALRYNRESLIQQLLPLVEFVSVDNMLAAAVTGQWPNIHMLLNTFSEPPGASIDVPNDNTAAWLNNTRSWYNLIATTVQGGHLETAHKIMDEYTARSGLTTFPNIDGPTGLNFWELVLLAASRSGREDMAVAALANDIDHGFYLLRGAILAGQYGYTHLLRLYMDVGAEMNITNTTADGNMAIIAVMGMLGAASSGRDDIIRKLAKAVGNAYLVDDLLKEFSVPNNPFTRYIDTTTYAPYARRVLLRDYKYGPVTVRVPDNAVDPYALERQPVLEDDLELIDRRAAMAAAVEESKRLHRQRRADAARYSNPFGRLI